MVKIIDDLIKDTPFKYGRNNKKKYITVHQTGNTDKGADAETHSKLQKNGNSRDASWHITVDDTKAIRNFTYDFQLWHAGDGRNGQGNLHGIAVEICINKDGDYKKAVKNGADVVKQLMKSEGIPISRVKQHHDFSGKNCPAQIRAGVEGIYWSDFKQMVQGVKSKKKRIVNKSKAQDTNSIVDYLSANGEDSSFNARKKLADRYGISGYKGTAKQNITLLKKLRSGSNKPKSSSKKSNSIPLPTGTLRHGDTGDRVENLQKILNSIYFKVGKEDGIYGDKTKDAVRRFQSMYSELTDDGIYGKNTRRVLKSKIG